MALPESTYVSLELPSERSFALEDPVAFLADQRLDPAEWLGSYTATYVERDVRSVLNIGDLEAFQTFLCLCAGRVGRLLNLSSFGVLTIRSVSDERDSSPDTWMREISF